VPGEGEASRRRGTGEEKGKPRAKRSRAHQKSERALRTMVTTYPPPPLSTSSTGSCGIAY